MCIDGMGMADLAVDRLIPAPSQWPEFYDWAHEEFDLTDGSWVPAGGVLRIFGITLQDERWNGSKPYGKMIHSIYLLAYALRDDYIPQWHARLDYLNSAMSADNDYHGPFYSRFISSGDAGATAVTGRVAARDRTDYKCQIFDLGAGGDDPAARAGAIVHESWHHWQYKYDWEGDHLTGGRIKAGQEGDYYYRHGSGAFDFGTLWRYDLSAPMRFHSPYQIEAEFLADLAEHSFGWIPLIVKDSARVGGNSLLANRFFNGTNYRIGQPRPF
jgi:hypothetical protein